MSPQRCASILLAVLTIVTGSLDAASVLRLGDVFTSVMTGNLVFLGMSVARTDAALAAHVGTACIAYVIGAMLGTRLSIAAGEMDRAMWSGRVTTTVCAEAALVVAFSAGWELTSGHPGQTAQFILLAFAATAMGMQSAAVRATGVVGASTTYMTGTLTGVVADLATPGKRLRGTSGPLWRLAALVGGAALGTLFVLHLPRLLPLVPAVGLMIVIVVGMHWFPAANDVRVCAVSRRHG